MSPQACVRPAIGLRQHASFNFSGCAIARPGHNRPMPASTERSPSAALSRIRLRHLQCFLAIVRTGTLGGAAQALSITQPAVTKTVNELEEILGTRLFVRGRRGATLTPEA